MTNAAIEKWLEDGRGPFTSDQLSEAFRALPWGKKHWKDTIDMEIDPSLVEIMTYAVPWHCGGGCPEFVPNEEKGTVAMYHPGYWACIGA